MTSFRDTERVSSSPLRVFSDLAKRFALAVAQNPVVQAVLRRCAHDVGQFSPSFA